MARDIMCAYLLYIRCIDVSLASSPRRSRLSPCFRLTCCLVFLPGMPLRMTPNFEDLSCEFAFGQVAARVEDDPLMQEVRHPLNDKLHLAMFLRIIPYGYNLRPLFPAESGVCVCVCVC